ncbi:hypothetical protein LguiB_022019 [Lonicera macranthoides]
METFRGLNLINRIYGSNSMPCKVINSQNLAFAILKYQSGRILLPCRSFYKLFSGEEPPESLFTKELKRRGINSSSLLEETNSSISGDEEIRYKEEDGGFTNRNAVSTDVEKGLSNQRERSMALNSEGLEGLIPRGKVLLNLGGTFFLAFGPFILITVTFFSALYIYFGPTFIHDGSKTSASLPQYIDPYSLLEDERISQTPPRLN